MQARQVVNQISVVTVKIMRLDVQLNNRYCRRKDCVFVMIFVVELTKANERRPEIGGMVSL